MKRTLATLLILLLALGTLAACGSTPASTSTPELQPESTPAPEPETSGADSGDTQPPPGVEIQEPQPVAGEVYRGEVVAILENGSVEVAQRYGYNYGQERIVFHVDEETVFDDGGFTLAEGVFVEVYYNGLLTRSEPAQGTADFLTILAGFSDGVVINGSITEVAENDEGYTLTLQQYQPPMPLAQTADEDVLPEVITDGSDTVIIHVAYKSLEHITTDELVDGTEVCVVTYGWWALSLPPQGTAHALLPFSP